MSLLISLPTELGVLILQEWIGNMKDICSLDAAFCVYGKMKNLLVHGKKSASSMVDKDITRDDFLQIMRSPHFRLPPVLFSPPKPNSRKLTEFLEWMYKRQIKPSYLYLPVSHIRYMSQWDNLEGFLANVKHCYLVDSDRPESSYGETNLRLLDGSTVTALLSAIFSPLEPGLGASTRVSSILASTSPTPHCMLVPLAQRLVKRMPQLEFLSCEYFPNISIDFFQLACLPATATSTLKEINLSHCHQLRDTDISMMVHQYRFSLEKMTIYNHPTIRGDCFATLVQFAQRLQHLVVAHCPALTRSNLSLLCNTVAGLHSLQLSGNDALTEDMLEQMLRRNRSTLSRLNLVDSKHVTKDWLVGCFIAAEGLLLGLEYLNTDFLLYTNAKPVAGGGATQPQPQPPGVSLVLKASNQLSSADLDTLFQQFPLAIQHLNCLQTYKLQLHNLWTLRQGRTPSGGGPARHHPLTSFACNPWKTSHPVPGHDQTDVALSSVGVFCGFLSAVGSGLQHLTLSNNPYVLNNSNPSCRILQCIALSCPSLRVLSLHRTSYPLTPPSKSDLVTWQADLELILLRCTALEVLDLSHCVFVNDLAVQGICNLLDGQRGEGVAARLKVLNLVHTNVTSQSISRIVHCNVVDSPAPRTTVTTVYLSDHYHYEYQHHSNMLSTLYPRAPSPSPPFSSDEALLAPSVQRSNRRIVFV